MNKADRNKLFDELGLNDTPGYSGVSPTEVLSDPTSSALAYKVNPNDDFELTLMVEPKPTTAQTTPILDPASESALLSKAQQLHLGPYQNTSVPTPEALADYTAQLNADAAQAQKLGVGAAVDADNPQVQEVASQLADKVQALDPNGTASPEQVEQNMRTVLANEANAGTEGALTGVEGAAAKAAVKGALKQASVVGDVLTASQVVNGVANDVANRDPSLAKARSVFGDLAGAAGAGDGLWVDMWRNAYSLVTKGTAADDPFKGTKAGYNAGKNLFNNDTAARITSTLVDNKLTNNPVTRAIANNPVNQATGHAVEYGVGKINSLYATINKPVDNAINSAANKTLNTIVDHTTQPDTAAQPASNASSADPLDAALVMQELDVTPDQLAAQVAQSQAGTGISPLTTVAPEDLTAA